MDTLEKIEKKQVENPRKAELLKIAGDEYFHTGLGGKGHRAKDAFRKHLERIANFIGNIESKGYQAWIESIPQDGGYTRIYLRSKDPEKEGEIRAYEQEYDSASWNQDGFIDPYPSEDSLRDAFDEAITRLNKILNRKYPEEEYKEKTAA